MIYLFTRKTNASNALLKGSFVSVCVLLRLELFHILFYFLIRLFQSHFQRLTGYFIFVKARSESNEQETSSVITLFQIYFKIWNVYLYEQYIFYERMGVIYCIIFSRFGLYLGELFLKWENENEIYIFF